VIQLIGENVARPLLPTIVPHCYTSATTIVLYKNEILRDKLTVLARENPELLNALVRLAELRGAVATDAPQAVDSEQDE